MWMSAALNVYNLALDSYCIEWYRTYTMFQDKVMQHALSLNYVQPFTAEPDGLIEILCDLQGWIRKSESDMNWTNILDLAVNMLFSFET